VTTIQPLRYKHLYYKNRGTAFSGAAEGFPNHLIKIIVV
jgi:hypothetical protein